MTLALAGHFPNLPQPDFTPAPPLPRQTLSDRPVEFFERTCEQCGRPFVATHAKRTACTDTCVKARERKRKLAATKAPR